MVENTDLSPKSGKRDSREVSRVSIGKAEGVEDVAGRNGDGDQPGGRGGVRGEGDGEYVVMYLGTEGVTDNYIEVVRCFGLRFLWTEINATLLGI